MSGFKPVAAGTPAKGPGAAARATVPAAVEGKDGAAGDVVLSGVASAGDRAPIDVERVTALRQSIEQGTYRLDPAKIAGALIASGYLVRI